MSYRIESVPSLSPCRTCTGSSCRRTLNSTVLLLSLSLSLSLFWIKCDSSSTTAVSTRYLFLLSFYFISFTCRLWIFCFLLVWIVDDIDIYSASNAPISGSRFCYSTSPSLSCVSIGTSTTAISNDSVPFVFVVGRLYPPNINPPTVTVLDTRILSKYNELASTQQVVSRSSTWYLFKILQSAGMSEKITTSIDLVTLYYYIWKRVLL